jgi:hypothetical protein
MILKLIVLMLTFQWLLNRESLGKRSLILPIASNEKADKRSWSEMQKWFEKAFKK